ncbi:MAG: hypothetical protein GX537_07865 [Actinobacteria bacterium]|nr:hypothetical protein [Actinomycetota bacterium]
MNVSIVLFANNGMDAVRAAVRNLRATTGDACQIVVMARECREDVAGYLTRECVKGRIAGFGFDPRGPQASRCGMDIASSLADKTYLVRAQDDLHFADGWLARVTEVLDSHRDIGCLGLLPPRLRRRRGRPPKPRLEAEVVERVDCRCFATRRDVFLEHECQQPAEPDDADCRFQRHLCEAGLRVAYLPGQVEPLRNGGAGCEHAVVLPEADLPVHAGSLAARERIEQIYRVGDDIIHTCRSCGNSELEVLAATVEFCRHDVPVGFSYTMRCSECRQMQVEEDIQFRCPT